MYIYIERKRYICIYIAKFSGEGDYNIEEEEASRLVWGSLDTT